MLGYLYVGTPGDDGQVDGEDDDEDQYAGKQEQPVLTTKLYACNEDDVFIMAIIVDIINSITDMIIIVIDIINGYDHDHSRH